MKSYYYSFMKRPILTILSALAFAGSAWAQNADADNTIHNKKNADGQVIDPTDQSNNPADIKTTAEIRKMIMADEALSALAKNVKIITIDQVVTLQGPVQSEKEKAIIVAHVKHVGAKEIKNEITVK